MRRRKNDDDRSLIQSVRLQVEEAEARLAAKPNVIGQYHVLEILGRGGMGVVYKAEQPHTRRVVALKVLRSNLVTDEMCRRFEKEAQVLGRLHHIGIAQIFEGGMADTGGGIVQPFFAMELVDGLPLTDYCETNHLDTEGRLQLLSKVCDAVEHAHQNNIIHRDLKPSNILVDSTGQPKVLDFGVARATDADVQAVTLEAEAKKLIGTLPYMSPEQVRGNPEEVDVRSDVYALGVLAYRVLTGRYPFDFAQKSIPETVRMIQQDEPMRLSLVNRHFRGDVETILHRALEKDPRRRFQSCAELAADLRRFLNNEPIHARPPSRLYRVRKFTQRNKVLVISVSTVMTALLAGFIFSTWGFQLYYQRVEEIRRLGSASQLESLREDASNLGPPIPQNVEKMETWLKQASELRPRVEECRLELQRLHERYLNFSLKRDFDRRVLRYNMELRELRDELNEKKARLDELEKTAAADPGRADTIMRLKSLIAELEVQDQTLSRLVATDHVCTFRDPADRLQHDALLALERDLLDFFDPRTGLYARIARRLDFARAVYRITIEKHMPEWEQACRSTADPIECPPYRGIIQRAMNRTGDGRWLTPQVGIVPIGRDPHSGLWEFLHVESGATPDRNERGELVITPETGVVFVLLPGGEVRIGAVRPDDADDNDAPNIDPYADRNEAPVNTVTLSPFMISKYEMTDGQWRRLTRITAAGKPKPGVGDLQARPADLVSWNDCDEVLHGAGLTLPTEAEWEYAARAGTSTPWWTGSEVASLVGAANLLDDRNWTDGYVDITAPVGHFRANAFGLYDMLGNVAEWCLDGMGSYDLPIAQEDGRGRRKSGRGEAGYRVIRGGGFRDTPSRSRVSSRTGAASDYRRDDMGVRPALIIDFAAPVAGARPAVDHPASPDDASPTE